MPNANAQPIKTLEQHIKELEAAMAVCLARPTKRPVHKLRSSTRRIEAQLQLLRHVSGLPAYSKEERKLLRELKGLRRAAGAVRDLDVHEDLLEEFLHPKSRTQEAVALKAEAQKLRSDQEKRRDESAAVLQQLIQKREAAVAGALEKLAKGLRPAEDLRLSTTQLIDAAQIDYRRLAKRLRLHRPLRNGAGDGNAENSGKANAKGNQKALDDDQLHEIRKAAKAARYMAESAAQSQRAKAVAEDYESLQESGGHWHDWLEVASEARALLGRKHPLTEHLKTRRDRQRVAFVHALQRHIAAHTLA